MTADADVQTLFIVPLGMGPTRAIPNPEGIEYVSPITWLPDGKRFVVVGHKGSDPSRAFVCDVESGAAKPFGEPGVMWTIFTGPPVSPDGKYVVLQGADGISKRWPIEGGEAIAIPGARAEDQPSTFTEDGAAIFVAGRSLPIAIERLDLATGDRTPWITVEPTDNAGLRYALAAITPNGKYWALSTAKLLTDLFVVEGLR
jgi:WD40 repeat protein